jgi:rfaE bifunctional protein nucleotidyltransferase chain/domain
MLKIVLANGCFDVLHVGHVMHLREAKSLGDHLIIALTLDDFVNKGPGRPINKWEHRMQVLMALRFVDSVVPSMGCVSAIRSIRPNIFVKGIDYLDSQLLDGAREACNEVGAEVYITKTPKFSSSQIIQRMAS